MTIHVTDEQRIRAAQLRDLVSIARIEVAAGKAFETVGLAAVAGDEVDERTLLAQLEDGRLWVSEVAGTVVAYVAAEVVDGNAHVAQVSVDPTHAGRRIGQALVQHVEAWGRRSGRLATTLTTFTEVPWNAPYYARLGYRAMPAEDRGPELVAIMAEEATWPGVADGPRCAMVKPNR